MLGEDMHQLDLRTEHVTFHPQAPLVLFTSIYNVFSSHEMIFFHFYIIVT